MSIVTWLKAQPRWALALMGFGLLAHAAASVFYHAPYFFIPDEIVYYLMNEALAAGQLALDTGYEDFASPMFVFGLSSEHAGRVVPQYPAVYAMLSLPFYLVAGKTGLFAVNQLCFVLILWLVFRLQRMLFGSARSAWLAVVMAALGGYLWVYSQAVAPHLLQTSLLLAATNFLYQALSEKSSSGMRDYLFAGLCLGLALGVRYDSLFALPFLIIPLLFAQPIRWRAIALLVPGLAFGLAILSYTNHLKFGTYMPFTYNTGNLAGHATFKPIYLYIAALGAGLLGLAWVGTRMQAAGKLPQTKWLLAAGVLVLTAIIALIPSWVVTFLYGFNLTVVDYSALPIDSTLKQSSSRTEGGGFLYLGEYKRALLQSAPFIALITLLALQPKLKTPAHDWTWLLWLALVPAAFITFFSLLRWDGGFAYHMRYYTPTLPFLAMIAAQALERFLQVAHFKDKGWLTPLLTGAIISIAAVLYADGAPEALREWMLLKLPLWLWAAVPLATVLAFYDGAGRFTRQLAVMMFGFCMAWGGASTLLVIYPHLNDYKERLHWMSASYAHYLEKEAIVISVPRYFTSFFSSTQYDLHVATIFEDGEPVTREHMRAFLAHFLNKGKPVYITHDVRALPAIQGDLQNWGIALDPVRPEDPDTDTPALSRFVWITREVNE